MYIRTIDIILPPSLIKSATESSGKSLSSLNEMCYNCHVGWKHIVGIYNMYYKHPLFLKCLFYTQIQQCLRIINANCVEIVSKDIHNYIGLTKVE